MSRKRQNESKPTISIIGAGRLGTALALRLAARGYPIEALVARRLLHARKAARLVPGGGLALSVNQVAELPASKLILIATPDDAIASVAAKLARVQEGTSNDRTVLHTSGALSSEVLEPLAQAGFATGSLHPLVSVSDPVAGSVHLNGAFYCLEGSPGAIRTARLIVRDLGGHSFAIESHHKALYHAAAVMASGHMTALFDLAAELLTRCGLKPANARRVLLPLLESTVKNLSTSRPERALTGTFARGDVATVKKHLAALVAAGQPDAITAYRLLGRRSLRLLAKKGGDPAVIRRIERMLNQNPRKRP